MATAVKASDAVLGSLADLELVGQALTGQTAAFVELMRRYNPKLYQTARSISGTEVDAEDIVQETWVCAYTHLKDFRHQSTLSTWLFRILVNEALGRKRRAKQARKYEEAGVNTMTNVFLFNGSVAIDPESLLSRSQLREFLESAIDALPDDFREVLVLRLVEDLSVAEVSEILGIPEATVKTRLHRARTLMRQQFTSLTEGVLINVFPFAGARCEALCKRVLHNLNLEASV